MLRLPMQLARGDCWRVVNLLIESVDLTAFGDSSTLKRGPDVLKPEYHGIFVGLQPQLLV